LFREKLQEKILEKLAPFEKFRFRGKEESRPGGGDIKNLMPQDV